MLVTSIFSFSHNVIYPSQKQISIFELHLYYHLQILLIWTKSQILLFSKELS